MKRRNTSNRSLFSLVILFSMCALLYSCQTVPVTERRQLSLIPSDQILSMSFNNYEQFIDEHHVIKNTDDAGMVERAGRNIQGAVEEYLRRNNMTARLSEFRWEFNLVDDSSVNAWAMPGGKVVVYTGILPVAENETGLAVVMGHEIAHVIANHGNERMSQALLTQMGGNALGAALAQQSQATQQVFMTAFGLGTKVGVLLPYSRLQESEADHLGLIFMAMAGYDPHASVDFWQRMADSKSGGAPPELLSTHPSDESRIRNIRSLIPEAMKYYKK